MILKKDLAAADTEVADEVWRITMEEVDKGWLQGPYDGPLGLHQSDKVRQIDNLSERLVNSAFGSSYKLDLDGVDGVSVLARTFMGASALDRTVSLTLQDGSRQKGVLHSSLSVVPWTWRPPMNKSWWQSLHFGAMCWRWTGQPGGPTTVVHITSCPIWSNCQRVRFQQTVQSFAIDWGQAFGLIWSNYYDDFHQLDLMAGDEWAQATAERLLRLVGRRFSEKVSKRLPFHNSFSALAVVFDLQTTVSSGQLKQLLADIDSFLRDDKISEAGAATLGSVGMIALLVVGGNVVGRFFFASVVPTAVMVLLQECAKEEIAGLELMAAVLAVFVLSKLHRDVDNEAARASDISMCSCLRTRGAMLKQLR